MNARQSRIDTLAEWARYAADDAAHTLTILQNIAQGLARERERADGQEDPTAPSAPAALPSPGASGTAGTALGALLGARLATEASAIKAVTAALDPLPLDDSQKYDLIAAFMTALYRNGGQYMRAMGDAHDAYCRDVRAIYDAYARRFAAPKAEEDAR